MERQKVSMLQDKIKKQFVDSKLFSIGLGMDFKSFKKNYYKKLEAMKLYLDPRNDGIYFLNQDQNELYNIKYTEIKYVNVSICSRVGGIRYNSYQVDLDIYVKNQIIYLEIFQPNSFLVLIDYLKENQVECIDIVGVIEIYKNYPDVAKRTLYLDIHFNELANKFKLDHPRKV